MLRWVASKQFREVFKNEVATLLATRGESVVAGGDLVLHVGQSLRSLRSWASAAKHVAFQRFQRPKNTDWWLPSGNLT